MIFFLRWRECITSQLRIGIYSDYTVRIFALGHNLFIKAFVTPLYCCKVLLETYTQLAGMMAQCRQYHFHSLILNVKFNYFGLVSYNRSRVLDLLFLVRSRHFESSQGSRGAVFQISETFLKCPANR